MEQFEALRAAMRERDEAARVRDELRDRLAAICRILQDSGDAIPGRIMYLLMEALR